MRRGTTPTHTFTTDIELSEARALYITYQQNGVTVLEKTLADVTFGTKSVSVTLTQAETLLFSAVFPVQVQIRAKFADESAVASQIIKTTAEKILKDGVI